VVLSLSLALIGCKRQPDPAAAPPVPASSAAAAAQPAAPIALDGPCPIVPVSFVMTTPGSPERTVLAFDAKGSLDVSFLERKPGMAKLDPQGCLVGKDDGGLWAEWAPHDKLWTPHETLDVDGSCLVPRSGRTMCIGADGKIEVRAKDADQVNAVGSMAIRGYRPEARCTSLMLVATFTGMMMPSMAVVDGKPAKAPAPEGSRCGAFRRPAAKK
jgi:hypothetical protein